MARWYGMIGYEISEEKNDPEKPSVHVGRQIERPYFGELLQNNRNLRNTGEVNESVSLSNRISIVADPFVTEHFCDMRYAVLYGSKWKIESVDASQRPRLVLTLGGLYNA